MKKAEIYIGASTKSFTATKGKGIAVIAFPEAPSIDPISGRYAYEASRTEAEAMLLTVALESLRRGMPRCGFEVTVRTEHKQLEAALTQWLPKWKLTNWVNSKGKEVAGWWRWLDGLSEAYQIAVEVGRHEYSGWMESEMLRQDDGWKDINKILEKKKEEKEDAGNTGNRDREAAPAPEEPTGQL